MFGLEFSHILVLAAVALIVLGPEQMPQLAKILGRTMGELRKAIRDISTQMTSTIDEKSDPPKKSDKKDPN